MEGNNTLVQTPLFSRLSYFICSWFEPATVNEIMTHSVIENVRLLVVLVLDRVNRGLYNGACRDRSLNNRWRETWLQDLRRGSTSNFIFLDNHEAFQMCWGVCSSSFQFAPQQGEKGKRNKWCQEKMTHRQADTCLGPWWPSCDNWRGRPDALSVLTGTLERRILPNHHDTCYLYAWPWSGCVMMAVWILGALKPCGKAICPSMSHHP